MIGSLWSCITLLGVSVRRILNLKLYWLAVVSEEVSSFLLIFLATIPGLCTAQYTINTGGIWQNIGRCHYSPVCDAFVRSWLVLCCTFVILYIALSVLICVYVPLLNLHSLSFFMDLREWFLLLKSLMNYLVSQHFCLCFLHYKIMLFFFLEFHCLWAIQGQWDWGWALLFLAEVPLTSTWSVVMSYDHGNYMSRKQRKIWMKVVIALGKDACPS